jgi:Uma2 family endonuclease
MSVQEATPVQVTRHSFTVAEYERMVEAGILSETDRVELIAGEVIEMSPIGKRHAACVGWLNRTLTLSLQNVALIWVQNPIQLDERSEPQADVMVLKPRADFYRQSKPTPADVLLVIEVSDTTLEYDRQMKVPLYARAGIPEVWVVNLADERIEAYADPAGDAYQTAALYARGDELQSRALAPLHMSVAEVLG